MRQAALLEPIGQLKQIVSECLEALLLFTALPLGLSPQHTCGNTLLMYVQTTTAGIDNFHRATPFHRAASDASKKRKSPTRALRNFWRLQFVVLLSVPAILVRGLYSASGAPPLSTRGCLQRYCNSSPFSSFVVVPEG